MKPLAESTKVAIVGGGPVGLLLSKLLSTYGVHHYLIERRKGNRIHPQAHYLNVRTMEILKSTCWKEFEQTLVDSPPSITWRDFVYGYHVTSAPFVREDQFKNIPAEFWNASPSSVLHLAQHTFESILLDNVTTQQQKYSKTLFGYHAELQDYDADSCTLAVKQTGTVSSEPTYLKCDYLIAADGAHSPIRNKLNIQMEGNPSMQNLMNIHFTSPGLHKLLGERSGMLYFIFNKAMVGVFVSHDIRKDEWVCQIPYFPPYQHPSDFTESRVKELLEETIFRHKELKTPIKILQISHWTMNAQVAAHYVDPKHHRIALVGDAAHRFPPAGGFGMNTGLQDAHNLAWKLASTIHQESTKNNTWCMESYHLERKKIAVENTVFAIHNFQNTLNTAKALGLNPEYATLAQATVESSAFQSLLPEQIRKQAFLSALNIGLASLQLLRHWKENVYGKMRVKALQTLVDQQESLSLIFPKEDIGFVYDMLAPQKLSSSSTEGGDEMTSSAQTSPLSAPLQATTQHQTIRNDERASWYLNQVTVGIRIPHAWWLLPESQTYSTGQSFYYSTLQKQFGSNALQWMHFDKGFLVSSVELGDVLFHRDQLTSSGPRMPCFPVILHHPTVEEVTALLEALRSSKLSEHVVVVIIAPPSSSTQDWVKSQVQHLCETTTPQGSQLTQGDWSHEQLQAHLQYPLFPRYDDSAATAASSSSTQYYEPRYLATQKTQEMRNMQRWNYQYMKEFFTSSSPEASSIGLSKKEKNTAIRMVEVYDVSNQWDRILSHASSQESHGKGMKWVAVRPDGHICSVGDGNKDSIAPFLANIEVLLGHQMV